MSDIMYAHVYFHINYFSSKGLMNKEGTVSLQMAKNPYVYLRDLEGTLRYENSSLNQRDSFKQDASFVFRRDKFMQVLFINNI